jgi:phage-related holin
MAFAVLLVLMVLDFITGLMVGYVNKELKSSTGVKGLVKNTYIVILIGCVI